MNSLIKINDNGFWEKRENPEISLQKAAELFKDINGKIIVEIGSGIQGEKSGNSSLIWLNNTDASEIHCVDLDEKQLLSVQEATKHNNRIYLHHLDGIKYLRKFPKSIDLLYLDFWIPDKKKEFNGEGRAKAYLLAYKKARKKMSENSIILIDDTDHIDPWKQSYIVPAARKDGYRVLWTGRQTALQKIR